MRTLPDDDAARVVLPERVGYGAYKEHQWRALKHNVAPPAWQQAEDYLSAMGEGPVLSHRDPVAQEDHARWACGCETRPDLLPCPRHRLPLRDYVPTVIRER